MESTHPRRLTALFLFLLGLILVNPPAARSDAADAALDGGRKAGRLFPFAEALPRQAKHLARLGADRWHALGYRGQGVKVAVLDSGFRGYREFLGKTLPTEVTVKSFRFDGNLEAKDSQHGILCGEVIHALAPHAELLFANWEPDHPEQFLAAVRWAREQQVRVISCSVIMPAWSDGAGGGATHAALARLLGPGSEADTSLFFASAGNTAQRHWWGAFHGGKDGFHEWKSGLVSNTLTPWGSDPVSVELCWRKGGNYDVYVYDEESTAPVAASVAKEGEERTCAVARFQPEAFHTYQVRIRARHGTEAPFHCLALGSSLACSTAPGSVCFPADGPEVIAVGAVDYQGRRCAYSACGGATLPQKPDLVAPVPFPSLGRVRPFAGTSAAAPQAAALAALWWSRQPTWTATQVRDQLRSSARDLGLPGYDAETGYGLVCLP
jgi:subtilisin family serine protease